MSLIAYLSVGIPELLFLLICIVMPIVAIVIAVTKATSGGRAAVALASQTNQYAPPPLAQTANPGPAPILPSAPPLAPPAAAPGSQWWSPDSN